MGAASPPATTTTTAKMGRLHSKGKGISASALPYSRAPPAWLKTTPEQVVEQISKLARKGVSVRKHLERNREDKDSKFRLILIESRIHRLARYYRTVGVLPPNWKYESATASTMVA